MPDDNLDFFPKEYRKAIEKFDKLWIKNNHSPKKLNSLLHNFCEKYTTCTGFWHMWINLIRYHTFFGGESKYFTKTAKEIEIESLQHFPGQMTDEWPSFDKTIFSDNKKSLEEKIEYAEFLLSLPHSKLSLTLATFNELSTKSTTKPKNLQLYYKNLEIFKEMHGTDINDGEKYIEILEKTENEEFVIKNIECQLAKNPWCQNLWIAYINFLENDEMKDDMALLSVLKRYCCFFISDKKMKEKYQSKIEKFSPNLNGISEFWIDSIKFELQFYGKNAAIKIFEKALDSNMKDISKFLVDAIKFSQKYRLKEIEAKLMALKQRYPGLFTFILSFIKGNALNKDEWDILNNLTTILEIKEYDFDNVVKNLIFDNNTKLQTFPFSNVVNFYISKNLDYPHLRKLYQTCKWFYFKYRLNLVHKLEIQRRSYAALGNDFSCNIPYLEYLENSIIFSPCKIESVNLKNLWLTNALNIIDCRQMSALLPRISEITLKYLNISSTVLTKNEFEILTKSKTIIGLELKHYKIKDEKNKNLTVEKILKNVPNAHQIKNMNIYQICYFLIFVLATKVKEKLTIPFFSIVPAYITPKSVEALLSLKFKDKFDFIDLAFMPQINAAGLYFEFLEKNLQANSQVHLYYIYDQMDYKIAMKQYFKNWDPKKETPTINWQEHRG